MANNVIETQIIRDDDRYVTIKVTGIAIAAGGGFSGGAVVAGTLLQANALFGANASQLVCPLSITDIKFSMDVGAAGFIQFNWISPNNVNATIMTFGQIGSATFDGITIQNNANVSGAPSAAGAGGDIGYTVQGLANGNCFNFILTFVKDQSYVYNNIPYGVMGWANTMNAYNVPWA